MAAALFEHLTNGSLRDIKETVRISRHDCSVLLLGVMVEVSGHEYSSVVNQQVDPSSSCHCRFTELRAKRRICYVSVHENTALRGLKHSCFCNVSCCGDDVVVPIQ